MKSSFSCGFLYFETDFNSIFCLDVLQSVVETFPRWRCFHRSFLVAKMQERQQTSEWSETLNNKLCTAPEVGLTGGENGTD